MAVMMSACSIVVFSLALRLEFTWWGWIPVGVSRRKASHLERASSRLDMNFTWKQRGFVSSSTRRFLFLLSFPLSFPSESSLLTAPLRLFSFPVYSSMFRHLDPHPQPTLPYPRVPSFSSQPSSKKRHPRGRGGRPLSSQQHHLGPLPLSVPPQQQSSVVRRQLSLRRGHQPSRFGRSRPSRPP